MMRDLEGESLARIEKARSLQRRLADECHARGLSLEEVAIAAVYAAFDTAEHHAGREMAAIEWLRDGVDVLEAAIMAGGARRPDANG